MKNNALGTENIEKLFVQYSVPTLAAMLFLGMNTIVDGVFVGRYIGAAALASVNIAMPFGSFLFALSIVIGIGAQSLIGRRLGAGDINGANTACSTAVVLAGGTSLMFAMVATLFPDEIARLLGANDHVQPLVSIYIQYLGLFLPLLALMMVLDYVLKTMAMPVYAMAALVVAVGSHVLLNWLFIAKFAWGIRGAALATGIAYSVAFCMASLPFFCRKTLLHPFSGRFDVQAAKDILYSGSSEGLSEMGTGITTFLFNITLMRYVGEMGVAAFTVISYISFIGSNMLIGLSDGVGAIISYNYGSRQMGRVKKALQLVSAAVCIIGVGIFGGIFYYSREVISLFLQDGSQELLEFAVYGAKVYAFAFLANGLNIVAAGYFTAIGNPKEAILISFSKGLLWVGIGIAVLPGLFGIHGIWLTVPVAEGLTIGISWLLMHRHFHKQTDLVKIPG